MPDVVAVIAEDQFSAWLPPARALALLSLDELLARKLIATSLLDGRIRSATEELISPGMSPRRYVELHKSVWSGWAYHSEHQLWQAGLCEFHRQGATGYGTYASKMRAWNVRFHPEGISRILEAQGRASVPLMFESLMGADPSPMTGIAPQPILPETAEQKATPAPRAGKAKPRDVRAWYIAQFAENPGLTFPEIEALASAHFKPLKVTRQPLRDVIGELGHTATRGNPAFRRK